MECRVLLLLMALWMATAVAQDRGPKLENKTYVVTSILSHPFLMTRELPADGGQPKGNDRYVGYIPDLLQMIGRKTGIRFSIQLVKDGKYGSLQNGEWTGMIGEVIRGEADFAAAPLTVTSRRERVIDFSKPFMNSGIAMVMSKRLVFGTPYNPGLFDGWLTVFSSEIWLVLAIVAILIWLCLVLLRRFHPDERTEDEEMTFFTAVKVETKGLFSKNPHRSCARTTLLFSVYIFWLLIFIVYVTSFFWFLSAPQSTAPKITSVADLLEQSEVKYGTILGGSTYAFFKNSQIAVYKEIHNGMKRIPDSFSRTLRQGFDRVLNDDYAFFAELSAIDWFVHNNCDAIRIGDLLNSQSYAFAVGLDAPELRAMLNFGVLEMQEEQALQMLYRKWFIDSGKNCGDDAVITGPSSGRSGANMNVTQITLRGISFPLLLVFFGMCITLMLALIRILAQVLFKKNGPQEKAHEYKVEEKHKPMETKA